MPVPRRKLSFDNLDFRLIEKDEAGARGAAAASRQGEYRIRVERRRGRAGPHGLGRRRQAGRLDLEPARFEEGDYFILLRPENMGAGFVEAIYAGYLLPPLHGR